MEYYSAIKRNAFESVLMRWMKLEPIIMNMCVQLILKEVLPRKIKMEARQGEEKAVI